MSTRPKLVDVDDFVLLLADYHSQEYAVLIFNGIGKSHDHSSSQTVPPGGVSREDRADLAMHLKMDSKGRRPTGRAPSEERGKGKDMRKSRRSSGRWEEKEGEIRTRNEAGLG
jgi:hypothetical protein